MKIVKITRGYVRQVFDTAIREYVAQEFIEESVKYETEDGTKCESVIDYYPYIMGQPKSKPCPHRLGPHCDFCE
jgi:hypothetical protein